MSFSSIHVYSWGSNASTLNNRKGTYIDVHCVGLCIRNVRVYLHIEMERDVEYILDDDLMNDM